MSRLPQLDHPCPHCGAQPGIRCTTKRGKPLAELAHPARLTAAAGPPQPHRQPGTWPTGTRPPDPPPQQPPDTWTTAIHAYRAWLTAGRPPGNHRCDCGCTTHHTTEEP